MISYKDIPLEIKESLEIRGLRKKIPNWNGRKLLSSYMDAYMRGVKVYESGRCSSDRSSADLALSYVALYYVIRKEFLKRMTPLVTMRSRDMLIVDNKKLMEEFDACLMGGATSNKNEMEKYIREIRNRMS